MVRNTTSTSPSSSQLKTVPTTDESPMQRLDAPRIMQLVGNDAETKALMTRVASGRASDSDLAAFAAHVQQAKSKVSSSDGANAPIAVRGKKQRSQRMSSDRARNYTALDLQQYLDEYVNYVQGKLAAADDPMPSPAKLEKTPPYVWPEDLERVKLPYSLPHSPVHLAEKMAKLGGAIERTGHRLGSDVQRDDHCEAESHSEEQQTEQDTPQRSTLPADKNEARRFRRATRENAARYTQPFCDFITENPTVFHAVAAMKEQLKQDGWTQLSEREAWHLEPSGRYFVERNGSSLIAFVVGAKYEPGNGAAILAGHLDSLTAKVKPLPTKPSSAGYMQLGVAPYAGAMNKTWWDRDLGIGGRVHVKRGDKIVTELVKLDWPIARIPSLAEHFGAPSQGPFNQETHMVPIIGLESPETCTTESYATGSPYDQPPLLGGAGGPVGSFGSTQPYALIKIISDKLGVNNWNDAEIINWELELFDVQPATLGGLNKEFIFAGRIDDKLCSWAALQALRDSAQHDTQHSSLIKIVGLFDDEEVGSLLRQGAKSNFLPATLERAVGSLAGSLATSDLLGRTHANSFLLSSDMTHAANPNFLDVYLANHAPHLNVGVAVAADANAHMTSDSLSTAILQRCADRIGAKLQVFHIRNDSRSGGTVGPMLSAALGIRSVDAGVPQLSMHSIRATTGALDPGLGVLLFTGFLNGFESVDEEFRRGE